MPDYEKPFLTTIGSAEAVTKHGDNRRLRVLRFLLLLKRNARGNREMRGDYS